MTATTAERRATCPDWCVRDHVDDGEDDSPIHAGPKSQWLIPRVADIEAWPSIVTNLTGRAEPGEHGIFVYGTAEGIISPDQARQLAEVLQRAVTEYEAAMAGR